MTDVTQEERRDAACRNARCHMRRGAVVARYQKGERGLVLWSHGDGIETHRAVMLAQNDAIIDLGPGMTRVTNMHAEWVPVPESEWTTLERVQSARASWEPPNWYEPGETLQDTDSVEFALLRALLTPAEQERLFGLGDWPCSTWELVRELAVSIDDRVAAARTLGSAMARLR